MTTYYVVLGRASEYLEWVTVCAYDGIHSESITTEDWRALEWVTTWKECHPRYEYLVVAITDEELVVT